GADSALQKAEDMVNGMLTKGFILGKDVVNKEKGFNEKQQLTSTASAKFTSIDQKLGLCEKLTDGASVVSEREKVYTPEVTTPSFPYSLLPQD
ncbi:hypothetical protein RYX36_023890, partial [Vicia faba]